jgi:phage head maturation protease
MEKTVKESIHKMTSHLQLISGYLEMKDYTKALGKTRETIKEMHALETSLAGLAKVGMTVPHDGAVVVPHGSTVVSHEDVNVDVDRDEVRAVEKNEVLAGHGSDNPKTK